MHAPQSSPANLRMHNDRRLQTCECTVIVTCKPANAHSAIVTCKPATAQSSSQPTNAQSSAYLRMHSHRHLQTSECTLCNRHLQTCECTLRNRHLQSCECTHLQTCECTVIVTCRVTASEAEKSDWRSRDMANWRPGELRSKEIRLEKHRNQRTGKLVTWRSTKQRNQTGEAANTGEIALGCGQCFQGKHGKNERTAK